MKKIIGVIFAVFVLCALFSFGTYAVEDTQDIARQSQEDLFDALDSDTRNALEDFGISSGDYSGIYNVSLQSIVSYFSSDTKEKASEALRFLVLLTAAVLLAGSAQALVLSQNSEVLQFLSVLVITLLTIGRLSTVLNTVLMVLSACCKFMLAYIPIFAALISFSGNVSAALTYNTLALAFSEGISLFSSNFLTSVLGCYFCLCIVLTLNQAVNQPRFVSAFGKAVSVVLGLISAVFASLLSVKGVLSASVDSVSAKGIRFIISSTIPVVGSAISDAYSTVLGSIGVIKGSVAFIGILACLIMNIPALTEALLYYGALSLASFFAEAAGCVKVSQLLKAFSVGIKFMLLLVIFEMFILIVSTGLMLNLKTNL